MKMVVLQTSGLQLAYLGCYGCDWADTEALDQLAAQSVVFDQHFADSLPQSLGLWTGCGAPPWLGSTPRPGLDVRLQQHGIPFFRLTAEATAHPWDQLERALTNHLEQLRHRPAGMVWVDLPPLLPPWTVPEDFLAIYFDEEEEVEREKMKPAEPLLPLEKFEPGLIGRQELVLLDRVQRTYAGVVAWFDEGIRQLVDALGSQLDDLLLVLTSDRGLALGEHGHLGDHRPWPHEEVVHLPLLLHLPGDAHAGQRVLELTQPADVTATLLALLGVPADDVPGHSLLWLADDPNNRGRDYVVAGWRQGEVEEWMLRTRDWCLLLPTQPDPASPPRQPQLFVKPDDRWEVNDVRQHHLELAEHLEKILRQCIAAMQQPGSPWPKLGQLPA